MHVIIHAQLALGHEKYYFNFLNNNPQGWGIHQSYMKTCKGAL
jgi:hypothetical protein